MSRCVAALEHGLKQLRGGLPLSMRLLRGMHEVLLSHPGGLPTFQGEHFTNGWLPALFQGTLVRPTEPRILNLDPPASLAGAPQERQLALLKAFNEDHLSQHRGELDLQARISSYELAAKMQTAAKEALDISDAKAQRTSN